MEEDLLIVAKSLLFFVLIAIVVIASLGFNKVMCNLKFIYVFQEAAEFCRQLLSFKTFGEAEREVTLLTTD